MQGFRWILDNWFTVLSAIGVVGGLCFTALSLRSETKTRKISNLLALTANHREVWKELFQRTELKRVVDAKADLRKQPISTEEEAFVTLVVAHLSSMYETLKKELVVKQQGLRRDVEMFFTLPIPGAVWERIKAVQNEGFVAFVEQCRRRGQIL